MPVESPQQRDRVAPFSQDGHVIVLSRVKTYESAAGAFTALKRIDLQVDEGEFVAVMCQPGSGKSTWRAA
jgi:ABC-type dipeptide/oligopeptide/nickel transport system ATPase subunit